MPYPFTDADQLAPLEDLLNAVVEAANARVQFGSGSLVTSGSGSPATPVTNSATIAFPTAFPPGSDVVVVCSARTTQPLNRDASATAVTETGFTVTVASSSGSDQTVSYVWTAGLRSTS